MAAAGSRIHQAFDRHPVQRSRCLDAIHLRNDQEKSISMDDEVVVYGQNRLSDALYEQLGLEGRNVKRAEVDNTSPSSAAKSALFAPVAKEISPVSAIRAMP